MDKEFSPSSYHARVNRSRDFDIIRKKGLMHSKNLLSLDLQRIDPKNLNSKRILFKKANLANLKYYPDWSNSSTAFTFLQNIQNVKTMKSLNFILFAISRDSSDWIANLQKFSKLDSLYITGNYYYGLNDQDIQDLTKARRHFRHLTNVGINNVSQSHTTPIVAAKLLRSRDKSTEFIGIPVNDSDDFSELALPISKFAQLKTFSLQIGRELEIPQTEFASLFEALNNLPNFESLNFFQTSASPYTLDLLRKFKENKLKKLSLNLHSTEKISNESVESLKSVLQSHKFELLHLNFHNCSFASPYISLQKAAEGLRGQENIENLSLNFCWGKIYDDEFRALDDSLSQMPKLKELDLNFNRCAEIIEGPGCLGESLAKATNLTKFKLRLRDCRNMIEEGLIPLFQGLQHLTEISNLDIEVSLADGISDESGKYLFDSIGKLQKLREMNIDLGYTLISDKVFQKLSRSLEGLKELEQWQFNFGKTSLKNSTLIEIAHVLKKLTNLSSLRVYLEDCQELEESGVRELAQLTKTHKNQPTITLFSDFEINNN